MKRAVSKLFKVFLVCVVCFLITSLAGCTDSNGTTTGKTSNVEDQRARDLIQVGTSKAHKKNTNKFGDEITLDHGKVIVKEATKTDILKAKKGYRWITLDTFYKSNQTGYSPPFQIFLEDEQNNRYFPYHNAEPPGKDSKKQTKIVFRIPKQASHLQIVIMPPISVEGFLNPDDSDADLSMFKPEAVIPLDKVKGE